MAIKLAINLININHYVVPDRMTGQVFKEKIVS